MPAVAHFATFVAAFVATLEYGTEGAQAVWKNRVRTIREELQQLGKNSGGLPLRTGRGLHD